MVYQVLMKLGVKTASRLVHQLNNDIIPNNQPMCESVLQSSDAQDYVANRVNM